MINKDRIIPVQKIDLLSLYGTVFAAIGIEVEVVESPDVEGNFVLAEAVGGEGKLAICNQPVKTFDFGEVEAATVLFVAGYDYEGFKVGGTAVETDEIKKDGVTLYKAVLATGDVTVTAVTPEI